MAQKHLTKKDAINLGSFYTPKHLVDIAYSLLDKANAITKDRIFLDTSCGYGDFFADGFNSIGSDIDEQALARVSKNVKTFHRNALISPSRDTYGIKESDSLIIIGNPPYNDKTSLVGRSSKDSAVEIDQVLKHRDLGISFLRSYVKLKPKYVCVLHPLSYLIKETNFKALKAFKDNYRLIDSVIVSSQEFNTKASSYFPVIIALYEQNVLGMDYSFIVDYRFKIDDGHGIRLADFDFIGNYISKYPNATGKGEPVAYFYPMRDINALKRNKTFVDKPSDKMIPIYADKLKYYYYAHHFKRYADKLPYYFGNLDVFIDNDAFLKIENAFMTIEDNELISEYFAKLFGKSLKHSGLTLFSN